VIPNPCILLPTPLAVPALSNNFGYWCTLRITASAVLVVNWQDNDSPNNQILIYLNNPSPFNQQDPSSLDPNKITATSLAVDFRASDGVLWGASLGCLQPGTYSVYFYNRGNTFVASSASVSTLDCITAPE
jgi:hypothetical protein